MGSLLWSFDTAWKAKCRNNTPIGQSIKTWPNISGSVLGSPQIKNKQRLLWFWRCSIRDWAILCLPSYLEPLELYRYSQEEVDKSQSNPKFVCGHNVIPNWCTMYFYMTTRQQWTLYNCTSYGPKCTATIVTCYFTQKMNCAHWLLNQKVLHY